MGETKQDYEINRGCLEGRADYASCPLAAGHTWHVWEQPGDDGPVRRFCVGQPFVNGYDPVSDIGHAIAKMDGRPSVRWDTTEDGTSLAVEAMVGFLTARVRDQKPGDRLKPRQLRRFTWQQQAAEAAVAHYSKSKALKDIDMLSAADEAWVIHDLWQAAQAYSKHPDFNPAWREAH
jgi:hypothetical protein